MALRLPKKSPSAHTTDMSRVKKQVESLVRGKKFTPGRFPPAIVGQPWNSITGIHFVQKSTEYLAKDVGGIIGRQAGLWTGPDGGKVFVDIEFRVLSVAVWTPAKHVTIYPQDIVAGTEVELTRIDGSSGEGAARVGYTWPASNQSFVLDTVSGSTSSTKHILHVELSNEVRTELHFKMLWRSAKTMKLGLIWTFSPSPCVLRPTLSEAADVVHQIIDSAKEDEHISEASSIDDIMTEIRSLREEVASLRPI